VDDDAVLVHGSDALAEVEDVERVTVDQDEVGAFARLEGAERRVEAHQVRG
jgi:hypothetical protein